MIVHLWDLVFTIWQHRNSILHDTSIADLLGDSYLHDLSLQLEWRLGFDRMPAIVLSSIKSSIIMVMQGSVTDRKGWFVLVRRAREQLQGYAPLDAFSDQNGLY